MIIFLSLMLRDLDNFYENLPEPQRGCLLAMRHFILESNANLTESWKYRMPVFCYRSKMFCYLWLDKKSFVPYVGIVEGNFVDHPELIRGERSRMKILYIDPARDLPERTLRQIFEQAMKRYQ